MPSPVELEDMVRIAVARSQITTGSIGDFIPLEHLAKYVPDLPCGII